MKNLLLLLILSPLLRAATPVVVVKSAGQVTIDGQPVGTVVDALANNPNVPNLRALLLDAWLAYEASFIAKSNAQADARGKAAEAAATERATKAEAEAKKFIGDVQTAADDRAKTAEAAASARASAAEAAAAQATTTATANAEALAKQAIAEANDRVTKAEADHAKATALIQLLTPANLPALPLPVREAMAEIQKSDAEKELASLQARTAAVQARLKHAK